MNKYYKNEDEKTRDLQRINVELKEKLNNIADEGKHDLTAGNVFKYIIISILIILTILYIVTTIIDFNTSINQFSLIINMCLLSFYILTYTIANITLNKPKRKVFLIIASILLTLYLTFLTISNLSFLPKQKTVDNFYNKDLSEVIEWAQKNNITLEKKYENSDNFEYYKVISQSIAPGTLLKEVKKITVIISEGPDKDKEAIIPDMKDWTIDKVIKYVDSNHLTNVKIEFEYNGEISKDIVFFQEFDETNTTRDTEVKLKVSLGKEGELTSIPMKKLIGSDLFHATVWLGRNAIPYKIEYGYSNEYEEGKVIKQSISKGKIIDKERSKTVIITVACKSKITVPDFNKMKLNDINIWAAENKIKLDIKEEFDDTIEKNLVIASSVSNGSNVEIGDTIKLIISKGQIKMIKFTDKDSFEKWAKDNDIPYDIDYQFTTNKKAGELIESSHKENEVIKNTDTVKLIISQGSNTVIPNFLGKTKEEASKLCTDNNLDCSYRNYSSKEDTIKSQSMNEGSTVPTNTNIELNFQ